MKISLQVIRKEGGRRDGGGKERRGVVRIVLVISPISLVPYIHKENDNGVSPILNQFNDGLYIFHCLIIVLGPSNVSAVK